MALPAMDVGLMEEHLATHEGIIHKLNSYYKQVNDHTLKEIVLQQVTIMQDHAGVMLRLLDPSRDEWVYLPSMTILPKNPPKQHERVKHTSDKLIANEAKSTAKFMANSNFTSALMMKNSNVKDVHFKMASQQATIQWYYHDFMKKMGWTFSPKASIDDQIQTIQKYKHLIR